jgi:hypothetical protein
VVRLGEAATAEDLTTVTADDLRAAYTELAADRALGFPDVSVPAEPGPAPGAGAPAEPAPAPEPENPKFS